MRSGLFVRGTAGNLILGDDAPTLSVGQQGVIKVTRAVMGESLECTVIFPVAIKTVEPPMVFAVPDLAILAGSLFAYWPLGAAGNWTGFRVAIVDNPLKPYNAAAVSPGVGADTGWRYFIGEFKAPAGRDRFGLRLFSPSGAVTFDSGWKLAFFRGLLGNWGHHKTHSIRNFGDPATYSKYAEYRHSVGSMAGRKFGIMMGALSHAWVDIKDTSNAHVTPIYLSVANDTTIAATFYMYDADRSLPLNNVLNGLKVLTVEIPEGI